MRRAVVFSALGLLLLLGLFKFPVPIYRDHTFLHFPVWEVAAKSEGFFFPLSNPYLNHGAPLASDPNHLLLYPTAWLLKFLPAQQAYSIHFFGHALLSFWLMAFLLMGRLDRTKALILAAFWVLSGPFLSASSSLNLFTAFCWVPGILLAAHRASVPGQILTFSMTALAGEPVIGLGAAALALVYSPNRKRTLVSLGLTALLFLPFFLFLREAFAYSTRMMGGQTWRTALNASLNPVRLLEALLPFLFGVPGTRAGWASFVNPKDFLLPTLGMLWLAFALFEGKRRDWIVLGGLLFVALGSFNPLVALLYKAVPQLAWLRFPEKFFLLAAFVLCWRCVDRPLHFRWLSWSSFIGIQALFYAPICGVLGLLSWAALSLWGMNKIRWALLPGLAFGLTMAFFTVPLSSDLYSLQKPEQELLARLQGQRVLDRRTPFKISDETRERYRQERKILGLRIEPPVKEPYYLRRRLLFAPTGMGRGITYAFVENTSGSGLLYYDMIREILPEQREKISSAYGINCILDDDQTTPQIIGEIPKYVFLNGRCIAQVSDLMNLMSTGQFDPKKEILLSGKCDPFVDGIADAFSENADRIQFKASSGGVLIFQNVYSPFLELRANGTPMKIWIAFGSLMAMPIPYAEGTAEIVEKTPGPIILFLMPFYAMLLSVFLWSLKSSFRRTTKPGA